MALVICCAVGFVLSVSDLHNRLGTAILCAVPLALLFIPVVLLRFETELFYALVLTCPLEIGKSWFYEPFESSGIGHELRINIPILLLLLLGAGLAMKVVTRARGIRAFGDITFPALLLLLLSAISCAIAPNTDLALFEIVRMIEAFLIYFVTANFIASEKPIAKHVIILIAAGLLIQSAVAIAQQLTGAMSSLSVLGEAELPSQWGEQELSRAGGLMGHPNSLAALLLMLSPTAVLAALFSKKWNLRWFALLAAGASIWALLITYSRAAWLALPMGVIVTAPSLLKFVRHSSSAQKRRLLVLGGAIAFVAIAAVTFNITSIKERLEQDDEGSAHSRIDMMVDSFAMIKDNYWLGVGLNNYSVVVPRYDVTGIHREWHATAVHNIFLLIAAETGIPSLICFIFMIYRLLRSASRAIAVHAHGNTLILLAGARLGVICFLLASATDPSYRFYPGIERTFWLLMAIISGYAEGTGDRTQIQF